MTETIVPELFPVDSEPYFAEFGPKLPAKLKNSTPYFLLTTELEEVPPMDPTPAPVEEPPAKKQRKRKQEPSLSVTSSEEATSSEEIIPSKKIRVKKVDEKNKLYMKAQTNGKAGSKGETIEALDIPNGTIIHLVKARKYVKSVIYYEAFWYDY